MWSGDPNSTELLLGKYQIIQPIKTGGTAAIYLAIMHGENRFTREVVIKRPLPHLLADPRLRNMFIDEAHVQSRLSHPNIVQVIDLVSKDAEVYLVIEYLSGRDLRELHSRLTEQKRLMPLALAVWMGAEICAGLHFAHEVTAPSGAPLNLVHRDVSPKNVRITDRGAVKLIDFGIAQFENRLTETREGSVKGTLGYMAPEQLMGELVDRRADVFAFGICLFQMIGGQNPFAAGSLKERIQKLIHEPLPSLQALNPKVDETLEAIVVKCLARDPDERYATAEAVQNDLQHYLLGLQVASPRQELVAFLEEMFPDIHDPPLRLREALTAISSGSFVRQDAANSNLGTDIPDLEPTAQVPSSPPDPSEAEPPSVPLPRTMTDARRDIEEATRPRVAERATLLALVVVVLLLSSVTLWTFVGPKADGDGPKVESIEDASVVAAIVPPPSFEDAGAATFAPDASTPAPIAAPTGGPSGTIKTTGRSPLPNREERRAQIRGFLKAGVYLSKQGRHEDSMFVYRLAFARSGSAVDPALYRNLALVHRQRNELSKMRACFNMYLSKRPNAPDASQIKSLLAAYPASKSDRCVSKTEANLADKRARRMGAKIAGWVEAAGG